MNIYVRLNILQEGKFQSKHMNVALFNLYVMTVMATTTMAMKNYEDPVRTRTNAKDSMQTGHLIRTAGGAFPHPREDMRRLGESGTNNEVRRTLVLKR